MTTAFNNGRRHSDNVAKDVASLAAAYRDEFPERDHTSSPVRFDDVQSAGALPLAGGQASAAGYEWATGRILSARRDAEPP